MAVFTPRVHRRGANRWNPLAYFVAVLACTGLLVHPASFADPVSQPHRTVMAESMSQTAEPADLSAVAGMPARTIAAPAPAPATVKSGPGPVTAAPHSSSKPVEKSVPSYFNLSEASGKDSPNMHRKKKAKQSAARKEQSPSPGTGAREAPSESLKLSDASITANHGDKQQGRSPARVAPQSEVTKGPNLTAIMRQAKEMEREGNYCAASRLYQIAGTEGHGPASLRLAELFMSGPNDLRRDYVEAVRWYSRAKEQGMPVPEMEKR